MLCGMTEAFWKKCVQRTKSGIPPFAGQGTQNRHTKANLAKSLPCSDASGDTLYFIGHIHSVRHIKTKGEHTGALAIAVAT